MKMMTFAGRTAREILRDPLSVAFGLGFPLTVLFLLTAIQRNVPVPLFQLTSLAPGAAVFGLSFLALFAAQLLARDRAASFLQRLCTTPLTGADYILGYALPLLPIGLVQSGVCYGAAALLGLRAGTGVLWAIAAAAPVTVLFISLGLLCGAALSDRQAGVLCGALLTNLTAWLSGIWFDLSLVGDWFERLARALPFYHAVELVRGALARGPAGISGAHLWWVTGYAAGTMVLAGAVFLYKMKKN